MKRLILPSAFLLVAIGCTVSESPRRVTHPPPSAPTPAAFPPAALTGPLPAGLYDVREQVAYDTCQPSRGLPSQVTIMKRHQAGRETINLPLPSFGFEQRFVKRVETHVAGYSGSGMAHPKVCPGAQQTYKEWMHDVTETGFKIQVDYEVADGWDCPNPRPQPLCRTRLVYEYRLARPACDARCDGTVPGTPDDDVPAGPVSLSCACR